MLASVPDSFTETFAARLASYRDRPCMEFEGRWYTGDEIVGYADAIAARLRDAGVADDGPVGLVVRNRPRMPPPSSDSLPPRDRWR